MSYLMRDTIVLGFNVMSCTDRILVALGNILLPGFSKLRYVLLESQHGLVISPKFKVTICPALARLRGLLLLPRLKVTSCPTKISQNQKNQKNGH